MEDNKYSKFGNFLARGGGQPTPTPEVLATATPEQLASYDIQRKTARNKGLGEMLLLMGDAFKGRDISGRAAQRRQIRQPKDLFQGQGMSNQFYNILLQGQKDESVRFSPMYKTAYNYLSQPKTETYVNEQGQQVTKNIPGIISKKDYLTPMGDSGQPETEDLIKSGDKDVVVQVSPERRKGLLTNIDTSQSVLTRLDYLDNIIDKVDPSPFTRGTDRAAVGSAYNDLLLILKDYAKLGVLAGADLELLNNWVGDPMAIGQLLTKGGAAGTKIQIQSLRESILRGEAKIREELGEKTETPQQELKQGLNFLNGKQIIVNSDGTGWIFKDTGEPAQ